jgi:hypothetical protein
MAMVDGNMPLNNGHVRVAHPLPGMAWCCRWFGVSQQRHREVGLPVAPGERLPGGSRWILVDRLHK